jgi:xylan 1,4-beta-xylosidase
VLGPHGVAFSDHFVSERLGVGMTFFKPERNYRDRVLIENGNLVLKARGKSPKESSPLVVNAGDRSYRMAVELELLTGAEGGLLLFYDERFFCGLSSDGRRLRLYKMGAEPTFGVPPLQARVLCRFARLSTTVSSSALHTRNDVTIQTSTPHST